MPTTCPDRNSCGSRGFIWLRGDHPSHVGTEKTLKACVRVGDNCCARAAWDVKVKKCSKQGTEYFVYYLKPAPGCPMRYCAGTQKRCDPGESSATGFTPGCSSKYPKHTKDPVVTVGVSNKRMYFKCKIFPKDNSDNVTHEITWYQGPEKQIDKTETISGKDEAFLQNTNDYGEKPLFCLGQNIYCKVRSYYVNKNIKSPYRKSNEFFAGFKINPKVIDLSEKDKPRKLSIISTVPIVCQDGTENCNVLVELGQTNTDNFIDYCTLKFKPGPAGQTREVEVVAKRDFVDDGDQTMFLKIYIPDHIDPVDFNCYKNTTNIKIKTTDVKTSRCTSTGDPHLRTFDGFYYNHFSIGDYVLVESKSRLFKVHVRTYRCHTVSCNCGIAVREGDDVIVVDMCRDNIPRVRFASTVEPQKGTTIERNNNGKSFVLNFPSGAYVRFDSQRWFGRWYFANLIVQLSSDDYQSTNGLCGTFDKNGNNDMIAKDGTDYGTRLNRGRVAPTQFTESWKLGGKTSLFYYAGGPRKCLATHAKSYCTCQETCCGKRTVNCDFEGYSQRPKYNMGFLGWKKLAFPGAENCGRRKRRDTSDDVIVLPDDGDTGLYDYNPDDKIITDVKGFPTPTGKSEAETKKHCEDAIRKSAAGKACLQTIKNFNIAVFKDQCVLDVQISDSYKVGTEAAITTMISACEEQTLRDIKTFWKKDSKGNFGPPNEIGDSVCPNECSGNGQCVNATCQCTGDFITADCSLKKGQPPVLIGVRVPANGLCDIRKQDCVRTRVVGYDFVDSVNLACKMTEAKITDKPPVEQGRKSTDRAHLLSFGEISCLLPNIPVIVDGSPGKSTGKPTGGYYIELSNDGKTFSKNKTMFLVYDSKCMECRETHTCKWKANSCKISNYCFAPGDANPGDWCQVCDPTKSNTSFVKRTVNLPPVFNENTFYTFKGQDWGRGLNITDPEGRRLKCTIIGDNYGMDISSAGVATWIPKEVKTYTFTVKATDPCGLSTQKNIVFQVANCSCEGRNGGYCRYPVKYNPASGDAYCVCPRGCKGDWCTDAIDGRICQIKVVETQTSDSSSSNAVVITLVVVIVILFLVVLIIGFIVFWLKKHKEPVNLKSVKELTLNAGRNVKGKVLGTAVNAYNVAHRKNDKNVQMKFGGLEKGSAVNEGYSGT